MSKEISHLGFCTKAISHLKLNICEETALQMQQYKKRASLSLSLLHTHERLRHIREDITHLSVVYLLADL